MRDLPRALVCLTVAAGVSLMSPIARAAQPEQPGIASEPAEPVESAEPAEPVESVEPAEPAEPVEPAEPAEPAEPVGDTLPNVDDPEVEPSPDPAPAVEPPPVDVPEPDLDLDLDQDIDPDLDYDESASIDDAYDLMRDSPEALTARRWLGAGIGATITGAVLVGGAIALSQTAACDSAAGNNCFADARDRAAVTMGVPGAALLLGGVAMTVVGAMQKRRIKAGLALAPGELGVVVVGRF